MTPFRILSKTPSPASVSLSPDALILENRYLKRVIDLKTGMTVSITDGDGREVLAGSIREGMVSVDGVQYTLSGPCEIRILPGNTTEKKFDYIPRPYNTHPYPYPAPGKIAELIYERGTLIFKVVYEIFDDMPVMRKSLYMKNASGRTVTVDAALPSEEERHVGVWGQRRLRYLREHCPIL